MKLEVKNGEYYKLEQSQSKNLVLLDNFPEGAKMVKEAVKVGKGTVKLWRVKQENGKWAMTEVSYQELFETLVKEG